MDDFERNLDIPMDDFDDSYDATSELSDLEIDDILGKENTDDDGIGQFIDPTADPDYDPNVELPPNSEYEYVKDPKTGQWKMRKKTPKEVSKKDTTSYDQEAARRRARENAEKERQYNEEVNRAYEEAARNDNAYQEVPATPQYDNSNIAREITAEEDEAIVRGADVVVNEGDIFRDNETPSVEEPAKNPSVVGTTPTQEAPNPTTVNYSTPADSVQPEYHNVTHPDYSASNPSEATAYNEPVQTEYPNTEYPNQSATNPYETNTYNNPADVQPEPVRTEIVRDAAAEPVISEAERAENVTYEVPNIEDTVNSFRIPRDLDVYAIHGYDLAEGSFGEVGDYAHEMTKEDAARAVAQEMSQALKGYDTADVAGRALVQESLAEILVDKYSTKVFTDPDVLTEAVKYQMNIHPGTEPSAEQASQIEQTVAEMQTAYTQAQQRFVATNREDIHETILTAKAEAEEKWQEVNDANIVRGTQAILERDAILKHNLEQQLNKGAVVPEEQMAFLNSPAKTPDQARAEYIATSAYQQWAAENKADYINEAVTVAATHKYGASAGYIEQDAADLGVQIKPNTVDVQTRFDRSNPDRNSFVNQVNANQSSSSNERGTSGWNGENGSNENRSNSAGGDDNRTNGNNGNNGPDNTNDSNTTDFVTTDSFQVYNFGDWVVHGTAAVGHKAVDLYMQLESTTRSENRSGNKEDDLIGGAYRKAFHEGKRSLGILGARGAFAASDAMNLIQGKAASSWSEILTQFSVDPTTGKLVKGTGGIMFKSPFEKQDIFIKQADGTMKKISVSLFDAIKADGNVTLHMDPDQVKKLTVLYADAAQRKIDLKSRIEAMAQAAPGAFKDEQLAYLRKDGGKDFFDIFDAKMNVSLINVLYDGKTDKLSIALRNANSSADVMAVIRLAKKEGLSEDSTFVRDALEKFGALKASERKKVADKGIFNVKSMLTWGVGTFNRAAMDNDTADGFSQIRSYVSTPRKLGHHGNQVRRLAGMAYRGHSYIHMRFWNSNAGKALRNRHGFFDQLGRLRDKQWEFVRKGGIYDQKKAEVKRKAKEHVNKQVTKFLNRHPVIKGGHGKISSLYNRIAAKKAAKKARKEAAKKARRKAVRKIVSKPIQWLAKTKAGMAVGAAFKAIGSALTAIFTNPYVLIALAVVALIIFALYMLSYLLMITGASGTVTVGYLMDEDEPDSSGVSKSLQKSINIVLKEESKRAKEGLNTIDGDPADLDAEYANVALTIDGEQITIEHFGHPKNELGESIQKASQGYLNTDEDEIKDGVYDYNNLIFIRPSILEEIQEKAEESGSIKKNVLDKYNAEILLDSEKTLSRNNTVAQEVVAMATAMFGNAEKLESPDAFNALVKDLYAIMCPEETISIATDVYSTQYAGDEDFTYYCNDKDGNGGWAYATYDDKGYSEYVTSLKEQGGALYDSETGMIVGTFYADDYTTDDIDTTEWHLDDDERGCEFDEEGYEEAMSNWRDDEPDSDDYDDDDDYDSDHDDWEGDEPNREDFYYCPGHDVTICYGHRDVAVYILQYTLDDICDDDEFLDKLKASDNYSKYEKYLSSFVEAGGFKDIGNGNEYKSQAELYLSCDWGEVYGVTVDKYVSDYAVDGLSNSSDLSDEILSRNTDTVPGTTTASRQEILDLAEELEGRIAYYYGGKASYVDFDKNKFGTTVDPDRKGRTKKGLDCSGYVDYVFAKAGIGTVEDSSGNKWINSSKTVTKGGGTGGIGYLPEYRDASKLKIGDLGLIHSANSGNQGASNHIGIFAGYNENGTQVWYQCGGSSGAKKIATSSMFYYYYDISSLLSDYEGEGEEWTGRKLTKKLGTVKGPSGKETYYNLDMSGVVQIMRSMGYSADEYPYHVRKDGVKMLGDYIMVAADLTYPGRSRGSLIDTSLGKGIVCDTGLFAESNSTQIDIAVTWS